MSQCQNIARRASQSTHTRLMEEPKSIAPSVFPKIGAFERDADISAEANSEGFMAVVREIEAIVSIYISCVMHHSVLGVACTSLS